MEASIPTPLIDDHVSTGILSDTTPNHGERQDDGTYVEIDNEYFEENIYDDAYMAQLWDDAYRVVDGEDAVNSTGAGYSMHMENSEVCV